MDDLLTRMWTDLTGRLTGPMTFRLILQPAMALLFACRDGLRDAHAHRPAYFWAALTQPAERRHLLSEGWKAIGRVVILAILMDVTYQLIVFRWVYPGEMLIVVVLLAVVPYALLRGPVNRIVRWWRDRSVRRRPRVA